jgi:hypothetical protein
MKQALIQRSGDGTFIPEMKLVFDEVTRQGWDVRTFIPKHLEQRRVPLSREALVVADVPLFESALKQLGVQPPKENCYPPELTEFLHRRIWPSTMKALEAKFLTIDGFEVFAKPRGRIKRFTGRMLDAGAFSTLAHVSRHLEVWCSEIISFASEHRAFVVDGVIRDVRPYCGNETVPSREVIERCVALWTQTGQAARGYGIDFGVLRDGRTALVEVNDGFALGAYGLAPKDYVELLVARWEQLTC